MKLFCCSTFAMRKYAYMWMCFFYSLFVGENENENEWKKWEKYNEEDCESFFVDGEGE